MVPYIQQSHLFFLYWLGRRKIYDKKKIDKIEKNGSGGSEFLIQWSDFLNLSVICSSWGFMAPLWADGVANEERSKLLKVIRGSLANRGGDRAHPSWGMHALVSLMGLCTIGYYSGLIQLNDIVYSSITWYFIQQFSDTEMKMSEWWLSARLQ